MLAQKPETLTIYTYDSFIGKGSLGEFAKALFEKQTNAKLRFVPFGSAAEGLNQIILENDSSPADILIGVDNGLLSRAKQTQKFLGFSAETIRNLNRNVLLDHERQFIPFDYGYLAFVYSADKTKPIGKEAKILKLSEFIRLPQLNKKIVIEDPRTSSLGLAFLFWTRSLYPLEKDWILFWKTLSEKLITIAPGWSSAYGLFLKGEADWVLSYTTSPAYHIEKENKNQFRVQVLSDFPYAQVEMLGVLKSSKHIALAKQFVDLMLNQEIQSALPTKQWMYPALRGVKLPASFGSVEPEIEGKQVMEIPSELSRKKWLTQWSEIVSK